ncbi:MAG: hypothetical protein JXN59_07215 [Anaerolineae bacterium]|nr:hypothetical protein [Anaerolineae bacterium]
MTRKYQISWIALLLGLGIGVALGLTYTWVINPVVEYDTQPPQLSPEARRDYLIAISMAYRADADLHRAVNRLVELRMPGDPFQALAEEACAMFQQGVNTNATRNAIEAMIALYKPQGRSGCADTSDLFVVEQATATPFPTAIPVTPTLVPPATKTPSLSTPMLQTPPTLLPTREPTPVPQTGDYIIANIQTFCSIEQAGLIEVYVQAPGEGDQPGVRVRVAWDSGEDFFFTGLKPERGAGYADFQMEANRNYTVELPQRSRRSTSLVASQCTTESGERSTTSYRVVFRRN